MILLVGLLPWFDNWAHIGGFFVGLFASCIFLPQINFGPWVRFFGHFFQAVFMTQCWFRIAAARSS